MILVGVLRIELSSDAPHAPILPVNYTRVLSDLSVFYHEEHKMPRGLTLWRLFLSAGFSTHSNHSSLAFSGITGKKT